MSSILGILGALLLALSLNATAHAGTDYSPYEAVQAQQDAARGDNFHAGDGCGPYDYGCK